MYGCLYVVWCPEAHREMCSLALKLSAILDIMYLHEIMGPIQLPFDLFLRFRFLKDDFVQVAFQFVNLQKIQDQR